MFTGIIQSIAQIKKAEKRPGSLVLTVATPRGWKLKPGDSVATDGACLTVKTASRGWYTTELMSETLKRTTFGRQIPERVNLERSLRPIDFLDGHIVQGHVDAVGEVVKVSGLRDTPPTVPPLKGEGATRFPPPLRGRTEVGVYPKEASVIFTIRFPKKYNRLVVEKGSVAVDGISLTVVDVDLDRLSVALIPYTLGHTTIGLKRVGDFVNLEFDVIAKYVQRML